MLALCCLLFIAVYHQQRYVDIYMSKGTDKQRQQLHVCASYHVLSVFTVLQHYISKKRM